jgi:hypothetical protein
MDELRKNVIDELNEQICNNEKDIAFIDVLNRILGTINAKLMFDKEHE